MSDKRNPLAIIESGNPHDQYKDIKRKEKFSKKAERINKLIEKIEKKEHKEN